MKKQFACLSLVALLFTVAAPHYAGSYRLKLVTA